MTFDEIMAIIRDKTRTDFQQAADIHAAWVKATHPSALSIKPKVERKARGPNKPRLSPVEKVAALQHGANGAADSEQPDNAH